MKYVVVAATLAGVALADTYGWAPVKPTTTTTSEWEDPTWVPVKGTTTTTSYWEDPTWSPVKGTTTTTKAKCAYVTEVPVKKCKPDYPDQCWEEKTKTTIYAETCTWEGWYDPATKTEWEEVKVTTTTSKKCAYVTEVPVKKCKPPMPGKPEECWEEKSKTTLYADTCTWSDWVDPTTYTKWEEVPAVTTTTTKKCAYVTEIPVKKCKPAMPGKPEECWEEKTKTTMYADSCTWSDWVEPATKTESWYNVPVVTSTVTPVWSKDGWYGPAWSTVTDKCGVNVVTSYGAPIWKPTPEITKTVTETWSTYAVTKPTPVPIKPNGKQWSITYTPWDEKSQCKTEAVIKADIAKIAGMGFASVRIYGTGCESLKYIGDACATYGLKLIIGVYVDKTGVSAEGCTAKKQVAEIITWGKWELVELIVIGNEVLYQGFCDADELVWFISDCKKQFAAAGYKGYCTTTEPLNMWEMYGPKFCSVVDVVAANLYAFFNPETTCDKAGEFIKAEIDILAKICPGKQTYVMESGWPSAGSCNGKACPGKEEQKTAIKSIQESCGEKIVFFSYEDELWKEPGQYGVEQHWGCGYLFEGKPKTTTTTWAAWTGYGTTTTTSKWADPTTKWAGY